MTITLALLSFLFIGCSQEDLSELAPQEVNTVPNLEPRSSSAELPFSTRLATLAFRHRTKFNHLDPKDYFGPNSLLSGAESYNNPPPISESLASLNELGLLSDSEVVEFTEVLDNISDGFSNSKTYGELSNALREAEALAETKVANGDLGEGPAFFVKTFVSLTDTMIVADILNELALESEDGVTGTLESRGLDCLFGRSVDCWGRALLKAGIDFVATAAGAAIAGGVTHLTGGAGATVASIIIAASKKATTTMFVAILGNFVDDDCACGAGSVHPCNLVMSSFVIDPASLDCSTDNDRFLVRIAGAEDVANFSAEWYFLNCEAVAHPNSANITSTLPLMEIRQIDPNESVYFSAQVSFSEPGSPSNADDDCSFVLATPSPDPVTGTPNWAWNIYEINSDAGEVLIDGPLFIDATGTGLPSGPHTYTANGAFRQIASTTSFTISSNFFGTDAPAANGDPFAIDVTWNNAGTSSVKPEIYSTAYNLCGDANPTTVEIDILTP